MMKTLAAWMIATCFLGGCQTLRSEDWRSDEQKQVDRENAEVIAVAYDYAVAHGFEGAVRDTEVYVTSNSEFFGEWQRSWIVRFVQVDNFGSSRSEWVATLRLGSNAASYEVVQTEYREDGN